VQDLFGKSGAKILPFLNDYVELGDRAAVVSARRPRPRRSSRRANAR
jgi:hypothetical protein